MSREENSLSNVEYKSSLNSFAAIVVIIVFVVIKFSQRTVG